MVFAEVSTRNEEVDPALVVTEDVQTIALFNAATSEFVSFSFTLDDAFHRERWDDVTINRSLIQLKKRT